MNDTTTVYRLNVKEPQITSLIILSAFASMGAIVLTPGLPQVAVYFHIATGTAQLTISSFLLGYALGQLIYGPIANRLGRKPAFYIGIAMATLGSLFSILSAPWDSFHLLIVGRLLEALGSSVGLVVCFTIINDFYYPEQVRRVVGWLMMAFAIVPGVGIALGGLLTQFLGWQSCFYFLLLYGLILIYPAATLPETILKRDPHALHHRYLVRNYFKVLRNKGLVGYATIAGLSGACVYVFCASGPFIGIHLLGFAPGVYGLLGLLPYFGTLCGSLLIVRTSKVNPVRMIKIAFAIECGATLIALVSFLSHHINIVTLLLPVGLFFIGHAMIYANASAMALSKTKDKANGSAMMNFLAMAVAVVITLTLGLLHISAPWIMPVMFVGALLLMVAVYVGLLRQVSVE